jgi:hypothetical protein
MEGVVKVGPVPIELPPVGTENQLTVADEVADIVTVPAPQRELPVVTGFAGAEEITA